MAYTGENKRKYQKEWLAKRRQAWIKEHGPCVICNSTDRMEVDHIDPTLKKLNPSKLWSLSSSNPVRIAELEKCQVLCYTCHKAKTKKQFTVEDHGLNRYERHGCRCDVCKAAKSKKNAKRYLPD